jgi:hypothetical protein
MSNVGAWDAHHGALDAPKAYGLSSYSRIAELVANCEEVADWGCGGGALRAFLKPEQHYVGVDGSKSPYATVRSDLVEYRSPSCAVVLRHVLEHNDRWLAVLNNAVASFTSQLVIVLFTPLVDETRVMFREPDYNDVPVIAFCMSDLLDAIPSSPDLQYTVEREVPSPDTAFGSETYIHAWRR